MWKDLSMSEKARYIKLGVQGGIKDIGTILDTYNNYILEQYALWKLKLGNYWGLDLDLDDYDYQKYYMDNPRRAEDLLNAILGGSKLHFPDGGKSGSYKKISHPTYPDLGEKSWSNNDTVFHLSDRLLEDSDRVLDYLGADLDYNNGGTKAVYNGGYVLPELTVTPRESYTNMKPNPYNTGYVYSDREFANGGKVHRFDLGGNSDPIYGPYQLNEVIKVGNSNTPINDMINARLSERAVTEAQQSSLPSLLLKALIGTGRFFNDEIFLNKGNVRANNANREWRNNPAVMQSFADGLNIAATPVAMAMAAPAWEVPYLGGALNAIGAYEGIKNTIGPEGVAKTYRAILDGRYWDAAKSAGGDVMNLMLALPAFNGLRNATKEYAYGLGRGYKPIRDLILGLNLNRAASKLPKAWQYYTEPALLSRAIEYPTLDNGVNFSLDYKLKDPETKKLYSKLVEYNPSLSTEVNRQTEQLDAAAENFYLTFLRPRIAMGGEPAPAKLYRDSWLYGSNKRIEFANLEDFFPESPLIGGVHFRSSGRNLIDRSRVISRGKNLKNVAIHEAASHSTDELLPPSVKKFYKGMLKDLDPDGSLITGDAKLWYELRATKNELLRQLAELNTFVNNLSDIELAKTLGEFNNYGRLYRNALFKLHKAMPLKVADTWQPTIGVPLYKQGVYGSGNPFLDKLRYAILYLPAATGVVGTAAAAAATAQEDNTLMANGGLIRRFDSGGHKASRLNYKDISGILGAIRLDLPDGSTMDFANAADAQAFFDSNYGNQGKSMQVVGGLDYSGDTIVNGGVMPELTVPYNTLGNVPTLVESSTPDPVIAGIYDGKYAGRSFTPTPLNILHFLNLYLSDKHINTEYSLLKWAKEFGRLGAVGATIGLGATAPVWAPEMGSWLLNTGRAVWNSGMPKLILGSEIAGRTVDALQRTVSGTTTSEQVSQWLQERGWNPTLADMTGSTTNPGYWMNFLNGKYTLPLLTKYGLAGAEDLLLNRAELAGITAVGLSDISKLYLGLTNGISDAKRGAVKLGRNIRRNIPGPVRYVVDPRFRNKWNNFYLGYRTWDGKYLSELLKEALRVRDLLYLYLDDHGMRYASPKEYNQEADNLFKKFQELLLKNYLRYHNTDKVIIPAPNLTNPAEKLVTYTDELGNTVTSKLPYTLVGAKEGANISIGWNSTRPYTWQNALIAKLLKRSKAAAFSKNISMTKEGFGDPNLFYFLNLPEELKAAISLRNNRLRAIMGDDGTIGGSSVLMEKGIIPGVPGDDDIITTLARYPQLLAKLEGTELSLLPKGTGFKIRSSKLRAQGEDGRIGDIDIIKEDLDHKAVGNLAHEIYLTLSPTEYKRLRELNAGKQEITEFRNRRTSEDSDMPLPITAEELYLFFRKAPELKGLSDVMVSHKDKHIRRVFSAILNTENTELIRKIIDNKSSSYFGEPVKLPEWFDLSNVEANKALLKEYNLPEELATNKEAMENISRYLYFSLGSSTRGVKVSLLLGPDGNPLPSDASDYEILEALESAHNTVLSPSNSLVSGNFGNGTSGDRGGGTFGNSISIGLTRIPEWVKTPKDLFDFVFTLNKKMTKELADKLNLLGEKYGRDPTVGHDSFEFFEEGMPYKYALSNLASKKEVSEGVAEILDAPMLRGYSYGEGKDYIARVEPPMLTGYTHSSPYGMNFEHGNFNPNQLRKTPFDQNNIKNLLTMQWVIGLEKNPYLYNIVQQLKSYQQNYLDKNLNLPLQDRVNISVAKKFEKAKKEAEKQGNISTTIASNIWGRSQIILNKFLKSKAAVQGAPASLAKASALLGVLGVPGYFMHKGIKENNTDTFYNRMWLSNHGYPRDYDPDKLSVKEFSDMYKYTEEMKEKRKLKKKNK